MAKLQTAFDLYLQDHPESKNNISSTQPVVFFSPDSTQPGMRDFRPQQLPLVEVSKDEPGPKDSSVMDTAPTPPVSSPESVVAPVTVERALLSPPGQQVKKNGK